MTLGEQVQGRPAPGAARHPAVGLQLAQAEANLAVAQAKLDQLNQGPTAQDVTAAQQNVASAQAAYDKVRAGPAASDRAAARAALTAAQKNYAKVRAGPTAEQLRNLAAQRGNAQAALRSGAGGLRPDQGLAGCRRPARKPAAPAGHQQFQRRGRSLPGCAGPPDRRRAGRGLRPGAGCPGRAGSTDARRGRDPGEARGARNRQSGAGEAATFNRRPCGARSRRQAAQAARDLAAEQLSAARLLAPFAGTVMSLDIAAGEYAAPGTPILRLADTSAWRIETKDLTELSVAQIKEGMPAIGDFRRHPGAGVVGACEPDQTLRRQPAGGHRLHGYHHTGSAGRAPALEHDGQSLYRVLIEEDVSMKFQVALATKYMRGRKLRTFLTTLAIVIGVMMIFGMGILLPTMADAFNKSLLAASGQTDVMITHKTGETFSATVLNKIKGARRDRGPRRVARAHHQSAARISTARTRRSARCRSSASIRLWRRACTTIV